MSQIDSVHIVGISILKVSSNDYKVKMVENGLPGLNKEISLEMKNSSLEEEKRPQQNVAS